MNKISKDWGAYLSRKTSLPLVPPDVLQLVITIRCNLTCKSCNVWRQPFDLNSELSFNEIKEILNESAAWGITELNILGGEPFIRSDWEKIVSYAKEKGLSVLVVSNGTLINIELAQRIADCGLDVILISLDGAKKETHDRLRGEGMFERILQGIETLSRLSKNKTPKIVLTLTVSKENLFELEEYINLARHLSVEGVYFTPLLLDNIHLFSRKKIHDLWVEEKYLPDLDKIFASVYRYAKTKGYDLFHPSFKLLPKYFRGELKKGDWVCFAGLNRLVVNHAADIQICGQAVGNLRKAKSLKKIWGSRTAYKRRRFVKNCANYCLQDCYTRVNSEKLKTIIKNCLKINLPSE